MNIKVEEALTRVPTRDELWYPEPTNGSRILGIGVPEDLADTLVEDTYDGKPTHVLMYLDWLLAQREVRGMYDRPVNTTLHERWTVVKEVRDYLSLWVGGNRAHPTYGAVDIDLMRWSSKEEGSCTVCLAGLWYLQKEGALLTNSLMCDVAGGPRVGKLAELADFLDDLSDIECADVWLGITEPPPLASSWRTLDLAPPETILTYLDWLLAQRTNNNEEVGV